MFAIKAMAKSELVRESQVENPTLLPTISRPLFARFAPPVHCNARRRLVGVEGANVRDSDIDVRLLLGERSDGEPKPSV